MAAPIQDLRALQILDSRGLPTLEVEVRLEDGTVASAQVPSGASTGVHEATELRDGPRGAFEGRSVTVAVENVTTTIADALRGHPADQAQVDRLLIDLDGTRKKSRLGANAILGVSCATARAIAASDGLPLWRSLAGDRPAKIPLPMVNILSGGLHAGGQIEFQDFLAVPQGYRSFAQSLGVAAAVHRDTLQILAADGRDPDGVADEGGWGPLLDSNQQALEYMMRGIEYAGFAPGPQVAIAIDAAASHFYSDGAYRLASEGRVLDSQGMLDMYERWLDAFPIVSIEDPLAEDDWDGWQQARARFGSRCALIGDDLLATNPERLERAISTRAANIRARQDESDRHADGDLPSRRPGRGGWLLGGGLRAFGRDGGQLPRGSRHGDRRGPHQSGLGHAFRAAGQIQPTPANRSRLGRYQASRACTCPPARP